MEKEEILAKAQKENKGKDFAELEVTNKATNLAFTVGGLFIVALLIADWIVTGTFKYFVLGGLMVMIAVAFIYKYIRLRKRHELVVSMLYIIGAMGFLALWVTQLCGLM